MVVRTAVLGRVSVSDILTHVLFTVPAGQTWIVKDVVVTNNDGAGLSAVVSAVDSTGLIGSVIFSPTIAAGVQAELTTYQVLGPGDKLQVFASAQPYIVWVSGSKLAGVAP